MPSQRSEVAFGPDTLVTDRGVFSGSRVDPGTVEFLRAAPPLPARGHLLDLGCGYGPLAVTMARRAPEATVWATDSNERALKLTGENAARLGLGNIRAVRPEAVSPDLRFAAIWSNPPIKIGKEPLHSLLLLWLDRLTPVGTARLVVHKHLGADSLAEWLISEGFATIRVGSRKGYRLLEVRPR